MRRGRPRATQPDHNLDPRGRMSGNRDRVKLMCAEAERRARGVVMTGMRESESAKRTAHDPVIRDLDTHTHDRISGGIDDTPGVEALSGGVPAPMNSHERDARQQSESYEPLPSRHTDASFEGTFTARLLCGWRCGTERGLTKAPHVLLN